MKFIDTFLEKNNNRVLGLDIIRSMAIFLVVYGHSATFVSDSLRYYYLFILPGIDGVSIFFVLSGFLIGGILLRTIKNTDFTARDLIKFWIRRWFRTLPNYYLVLIGLSLLVLRFSENDFEYNFTYYIFSQNLFTNHPSFFPEAWSLSVEEWFYLMFPLLFFILLKITKNKKNSFLFTAIFFIIVPLLLRIIKHYLGIEVYNWDLAYRKIVILRLDALMYGILGAYLYHYRNHIWKKIKNYSLFVGLVIILYITLYSKYRPDDIIYLNIYCYNLESIATFLLLPYFSELKRINFKYVTFTFTFISIISYSMYLLNFSLILGFIIPYTILKLGLNNHSGAIIDIFRYLLFWFYLFTGSYLLHRFYEKPIMNLRDRIKI